MSSSEVAVTPLARNSARPAARRLLIDLSPLRRSRDFRHLVWGELVSVLGNQLTTVAVPYQVYQLTHSSLYVGLVSTTQLFPLIAGSLLGGSVVDAMDRRRLLMVAQVLMAACSAGLAINADLDTSGTALWPLFVLPALSAGFSGLDSAGRSAIVPNLVRRSEVSTANAIFQALFQFGLVAGPALAGLLLAGAGVQFVYWMDVASFGAAGGPADRRGHRRAADRGPGGGRGGHRVRQHRVRRLRRLACIAGAVVLARLLPGFRRQRMEPGAAGSEAVAAQDGPAEDVPA
jgi:MFS family permease